jgi:hypothetical protein
MAKFGISISRMASATIIVMACVLCVSAFSNAYAVTYLFPTKCQNSYHKQGDLHIDSTKKADSQYNAMRSPYLFFLIITKGHKLAEATPLSESHSVGYVAVTGGDGLAQRGNS